VVVQVISHRIVKRLLKQGKKVDSKAAVISKMIRSALLKQAKRGVSIAMVVDVNLTTLNSSHY